MFTSRILALKNAFNGLRQSIKGQVNIKLHCLALVLVVAFGFYFKISVTEWAIIILISTLVLAAEIANTAIEKICNLIEPNYSPKIKVIKDLSAATVLLTCIGALFLGLLIFIPKIL